MKQITQGEFDKVVELHIKWRNDEEGGVRAVLVETDLSEIDFSDADLRYADLRYADLSYANLRYANLSSADLRSADLRYANLRSADLRYANLSSANLRYADLSSANLSSADLRSADLSYADLSSANLVHLRADEYAIYINAKTMQIGCQNHTHEEWFSFDDDDLASMHGTRNGVERWAFWKPVLKTICDQLKSNAEEKEAESTAQNS